MRHVFITVLAVLLCAPVAFAGGHGHQKPKVIVIKGKQGPAGPAGEQGAQGDVGPSGPQGSAGVNAVNPPQNLYGAKLDAPYLVQLSDNWYVGAEGGKNLNYTDSSEGWFAYGKVTYTGTLFSLKKK